LTHTSNVFESLHILTTMQQLSSVVHYMKAGQIYFEPCRKYSKWYFIENIACTHWRALYVQSVDHIILCRW